MLQKKTVCLLNPPNPGGSAQLRLLAVARCTHDYSQAVLISCINKIYCKLQIPSKHMEGASHDNFRLLRATLIICHIAHDIPCSRQNDKIVASQVGQEEHIL
jgi:hypothetical protein